MTSRDDTADVLIIGSGASGAAVALRIASTTVRGSAKVAFTPDTRAKYTSCASIRTRAPTSAGRAWPLPILESDTLSGYRCATKTNLWS